MTGKFKVCDMVHLYGDVRKLMDRRNEARICGVHKFFYTAQKMSNGRIHSYYEDQLTLIPFPDAN